jgi:predicted house-cleaning noncanonical NTP pyrophosphatase (MazG superfamily)
MTIYNKLVRDLIPEIVAAKGGEAKIHIAEQEEYEKKLREKLQEEVLEFLESGKPEELADILEVVYALGAVAGVDQGQLENLRRTKAQERGAFERRIILEES